MDKVESRKDSGPQDVREGAFRMARLLRKLKARFQVDTLAGEPVGQLVRRWSQLRAPELDLEVREYDARWPAVFEAEKQRIQAALADQGLVDIQHVGSTSIPPLPSKNVLDLAVAVRSLPCTESQAERLMALGYQPYGPSPIAPEFSWFWRVESDGAFVVHVCGHQSAGFSHLVNFRDFLCAFPQERERYESFKRELAAGADQDWLEYSVLKTALVIQIVERATAWVATRDGTPTHEA